MKICCIVALVVWTLGLLAFGIDCAQVKMSHRRVVFYDIQPRRSDKYKGLIMSSQSQNTNAADTRKHEREINEPHYAEVYVYNAIDSQLGLWIKEMEPVLSKWRFARYAVRLFRTAVETAMVFFYGPYALNQDFPPHLCVEEFDMYLGNHGSAGHLSAAEQERKLSYQMRTQTSVTVDSGTKTISECSLGAAMFVATMKRLRWAAIM